MLETFENLLVFFHYWLQKSSPALSDVAEGRADASEVLAQALQEKVIFLLYFSNSEISYLFFLG